MKNITNKTIVLATITSIILVLSWHIVRANAHSNKTVSCSHVASEDIDCDNLSNEQTNDCQQIVKCNHENEPMLEECKQKPILKNERIKQQEDKHVHNHKETEEHGHRHEHEHKHGHEHAPITEVGSMSIEKLQAIECEHDIKSIDCDECRYEIGAVKVTNELSKILNTEILRKQQQRHEILFRGELEFENNLIRTIVSPISAIIASMSVRTGDEVKTGQLIAILKSRELAKISLDLQKISSELSLAKKKYEREEMLNLKKIGATEALQNAKLAYDNLLLESKLLKGELKIMGVNEIEISKIANAQDAPALSGQLAIIAPANGQITKLFFTVGAAISEYQALTEIVDISRLRIKALISEKDLSSLFKNEKIGCISGYLKVTAFGEKQFAIKAMGLASEVSKETRLPSIYLDVDNPEQMLRPGMFAEGKLYLGDNQELFLIPAAALLKDGEQKFVFLKQKDMFYMRSVSVENEFSDPIVITSGLAEGDIFVSQGAFLLQSDVFRSKMGAGCAH